MEGSRSPPLISLYALLTVCASRRVAQDPRWAKTKRPYTAADVGSKRGTLPISYPSDVQAKKLFRLLSEHFKKGTPSHTYGA